MNYGEALEALKQGKVVSTKRWFGNGAIRVELQKHETHKELVLEDTIRNVIVNFSPSVENQLDDEWYIVE
jgi:hypothetical protein